MAHGGYGNHRRVADRKQAARRRPKSLAVSKKAKTKPSSVSLKNLIRSTERMLRKVILTQSIRSCLLLWDYFLYVYFERNRTICLLQKFMYWFF